MMASSGVPARLSSFVGRKKEMGELRRLFPHTRVLTLLGPGGAGKTRLAVEFARQQESRFADGSIIVELAAVRDCLRQGQEAGWTSQRVAEALNAAGQRTPRGRAFTGSKTRRTRLLVW